MQSGTLEHPTPKHLISHMLADLLAGHAEGWADNWVTFETKRAKYYAEVAQEKDELVVVIAYPFSEDYHSLFARRGFGLPEGWRIKKFSRKILLLGGGMVLSTTVKDQERVVDFIDRLFPILYDAVADYKLTGYFQ